MKILAFIPLIASLGLVACQTTTPVEADYGTSFKQMSENQVYDPSTLTTPSTVAAEGADPEVLEQAIKGMRTEKTDRSKVGQPLIINIGGQSGQ
jgi:hypothetical protein